MLATISAAITASVISSCALGDTELVTSCEKYIKKSLKSPQSYTRINITTSSDVLTPEQYVSIEKSPAARRLMITHIQKHGTKVFETTSFIEYEAANSFGSKVRDTVTCKAKHEEGKDPTVDTINNKNPELWSLGL